MADIAQLVVNGLLVGGIYAIGGVGLTLVYGILDLVNFAHGDTLTFGAFLAWLGIAGAFGLAAWQLGLVLALALLLVLAWDLAVTDRLQTADRAIVLVGALLSLAVPLWDIVSTSLTAAILSGLVISTVGVAAFSVALDHALWVRLTKQNANLLTMMIVSIGLAFVLRSTLQIFFGGGLKTFFSVAPGQAEGVLSVLGWFGLGDLRLTRVDVWILATSLIAIIATHLVLTRTRSGKAMRALSDNRDLAAVAGIDTRRVIMHVWILGGALAGLAGFLLALFRGSFDVNLGWLTLLSLFSAVILGGVGSAPGAMLGGIVIGLAQELSTIWIDPGYKIAVGFAILILTLLVRPRGIMGVPQS